MNSKDERISGSILGAKLKITHLSFADDLLLFTGGDLLSIIALHKCFLLFSEVSVLQANMGKNAVFW